jgi:WD40 repeat protein
MMMTDKEAEENLPPCSPHYKIVPAKNSELKITEKYVLGDCNSATFCVRFDWNDKYIAAGKGDGSIHIYNVFTGKCSYTLCENMLEPMPTTNIRYLNKLF